MAYSIPNMTPVDPTKQFSPANYSGQQAFQTTKPAPMYTAPAAVPKTTTTPMYTAPKVANPAPLVNAVTNDYNSAANVAARAQLAQEAANNAKYGNGQGIAPSVTPAQMSQQAEVSAVTQASQANPGTLYQAPTSNGTASNGAPTYYQATTTPGGTVSPTVSALQSSASTVPAAPGGFNASANNYGGSPSSVAGPTGTSTFTPEVINNLDGTYNLTRDNTWTQANQNVYDSAKSELDQLEAQNAAPGQSPAVISLNQNRIDYLRSQVNTLGQQFQQYGGNTNTQGQTSDEYAQSILTDPHATTDAASAARALVGLNSQTYKTDATKAATLTADSEASANQQAYKADRDKLLNQFALRGLSPSTDSWAQQQLNDLDDKYNEIGQASAAKAQAAVAGIDDKTRQYLSDLADKRLAQVNKEKDQQVAQQTAIANAYAKTTNADTNVSKLSIDDQKNVIEQARLAHTITDDEAKRAIDQINADSQTTLRTSQANLADANADYTTNSKTDNTDADTALKTANTNKINTLLPAQLAQINATVAKLQRVGSGTGTKVTATPAELAAVVQLNKGNVPTSDKALATLLNAVRTVNGDVNNLVTVGNNAAKARAVATSVTSNVDNLF